MEKSEVKQSNKKPEKAKKSKDKKKIACIAVFAVGLFTLVLGAVFLVLNLFRGNVVADGEYLVSAGNWVLDVNCDGLTTCTDDYPRSDCHTDECGAGKVVWDFTEIGKGKLTTDGGEHYYDFEWTIKDNKLIIQTNWLYELDNEYEYSLDQSNNTLTLEDDRNEYKFTAQQ